MSFWTMIFIVAVLGIAYAFWHRHTDMRQGIVRDERGRPVIQDDAGRAELQREVEDLRERIKVLERIATDERGPARLSAEIDQLREEREESPDVRQ